MNAPNPCDRCQLTDCLSRVGVSDICSSYAIKNFSGGGDLGKLGRNAWPRTMTACRAAVGSLWPFAPANCSCTGLRGGTNVKLGHSSPGTDAMCGDLRMAVPPGSADQKTAPYLNEAVSVAGGSMSRINSGPVLVVGNASREYTAAALSAEDRTKA